VTNNFSAICIDANLLIRLVADPDDQAVHGWWEEWAVTQPELVAPTLLHYEVINAIYQYQRHDLMEPATVRTAIQAALAVPVRLIGDPELHGSAHDLATRFSLPAAYDAHYLALANRLGIPFYTVDERLHRRVRPALTWVHLIGRNDDGA
jgi:predicted nucleic acid-binding protein